MNSAPEHGNPFPSQRESLEPLELEICDPSLGATFGGDTALLHTSAAVIDGAGGRMVTASVANGSAADILIRLPRRWKVTF